MKFSSADLASSFAAVTFNAGGEYTPKGKGRNIITVQCPVLGLNFFTV